MISILFVAKNSVYKTMTDSAGEPLDCWDEERDAMKWPGGNTIVAHPPCRLFSALKHMSTAPISEKKLAHWAIKQVRNWGGVLEHPANSGLWKEANLPLPDSLERDTYGGYAVEIDQHRFGHLGLKKTWLYICGDPVLSAIPSPRVGRPINLFTGSARGYHPGSRHSGLRSATPPAFGRWLVETAERCRIPVDNSKQPLSNVTCNE